MVIHRRLNLRITGRVQGVGFRWFVLNEARRLGLGGFVRNLSDGTVEVEAEGTEDALSRLEAACRKGPPASVVRRVDVDMSSESGPAHTEFEIR